MFNPPMRHVRQHSLGDDAVGAAGLGVLAPLAPAVAACPSLHLGGPPFEAPCRWCCWIQCPTRAPSRSLLERSEPCLVQHGLPRSCSPARLCVCLVLGPRCLRLVAPAVGLRPSHRAAWL